jgi:UrcA family protein
MRLSSLALAGSLTLGGAAALAAAPSTVVSYANLDLSQPRDAQVLYSRIRRAADLVCANYVGYDLAASTQHDTCVMRAVDDAVRVVNRPVLDAVHRAHTGRGNDLRRLAERSDP